MNIILTFNLRKNGNSVVEFLKTLKSTKHKILFFILDCRQKKGDIDISLTPEGVEVKKIDIDMEDYNKTLGITINIARQLNIDLLMNVEENIRLREDSLDRLFSDDFINDANIGGVYSDFNIKQGKYLLPFIHTSFPSKQQQYPLIAFRDPPPNRRNPDIPFFELISKTSIIKHIPELLCTVENE